MTDESIERLIDALNARQMCNRIFLTPLSETVDLAKVWLNEPQGGGLGEGSSKFFFIKNETGLYVAAVLNMTSDLHVFVKEEHRGKEHLSKAMKAMILPKLYQEGTTTQTITFKNSYLADRCLSNWGLHRKWKVAC